MSQLHRPCPACGGNDRLYFIADPHDGGAPYWRCRQCDYTEAHDGDDAVESDYEARQQTRTPEQIAESHYAYTVVAVQQASAIVKLQYVLAFQVKGRAAE